MTREGEKLVGVNPEQLTVTLLYDARFSPYQIEEILRFPAQTGYNWLDVVAERGGVALGDAPHSGRHPPAFSRPIDRTNRNRLHASYRGRLH